MTLTYGRVPFGLERGSYDNPTPADVSYAEPWPRRMRAVLAGRTVLDTRENVLLHRTSMAPMLLIPMKALAADTLSADSTGGRWTITAAGRTA